MLLVTLAVVFTTLLVVPAQAKTRTYFLAAVEEDWDYAPGGNLATNDTASSNFYLQNGPGRIGSVYLKALYREFTDDTFTVVKPRLPSLGFLGPILRAEEGDRVIVVFRNLAFLANKNFSAHPHGLQYLKNHEGAMYLDQTFGSFKVDDGIPPGQTYTYIWDLPSSFANLPEDDPCIPWGYHSHTTPEPDVDTGLVGLLTTCKKGTLGPNDERRDVQAEYPLYLESTDENNSWLFRENLKKCGNPQLCAQLANQPGTEEMMTDFQRSNIMRHINGLMYGNLQGLTASTKIGDNRPVVFYLMGINRDIQSIHFSGQVLSVRGLRQDIQPVYPATFYAANMQAPVFSGSWLIASKVTESLAGGQMAFFNVDNDHKSFSRNQNGYLAHPVSQPSHYGYGRKKRSVLPATRTDRLYSYSPDQVGFTVDHVRADGMMSFKAFSPAPVWNGNPYWTSNTAASALTGKGIRPADRTYYLGIEDYIWDYAPSGQDLFFGGPINQGRAAPYFSRGPQRIGGQYLKSRYVLFADGTYQQLVPRDASQEHLGMLGPVLTMEVGETVSVTVRNFANRPYTFYPHGVVFSKNQEGYVYKNPSNGQLEGLVVMPGQTQTYRFIVPVLAQNDNPCIARFYQSALDPIRDMNTGLVGPMLICQRGQLPTHSSPYTVPLGYRYGHNLGSTGSGYSRGFHAAPSWFEQHKHFFLNFFTVDENLSWHIQYNIDHYTTNPASVNASDPGFEGSNRRFAINGLSFGNLQGLYTCQGEDVAWHLFGVGDRMSVHGANFHGDALDFIGNHLNAKVVIPGVSFTLTTKPNSLGNWAVVCRTNMHFNSGMVAKYSVSQCPDFAPQGQKLSGVVRNYFVAAEEVKHDYAPLKRDLLTGESLFNPSLPGYIFVRNDTGFIGTVYTKARYFRYTDTNFNQRFPEGAEEEHLGVLGPELAAEVGDVVRVEFFNRASRPYSMHPQGVSYNKDNEGATYVDGAPPTTGDSVPPGQRFVYEWTVPASAGPGPSDPACIPYMYYSYVDSVKDVYSGLIGPLLLCRPGTLVATSPNGKLRRKDVNKSFWQLYSIIDENDSWYLEQNTKEYAPARFSLPQGVNNSDFILSNTMHSINGKIYGNVRGMVMDNGDVVAWYLLGYGSSMDFHPVHYHGQTFIQSSAKKTLRGDVMEVFSSVSQTMTMFCDNPGEWLVHCHFQTHAVEGMEATYQIRPVVQQG